MAHAQPFPILFGIVRRHASAVAIWWVFAAENAGHSGVRYCSFPAYARVGCDPLGATRVVGQFPTGCFKCSFRSIRIFQLELNLDINVFLINIQQYYACCKARPLLRPPQVLRGEEALAGQSPMTWDCKAQSVYLVTGHWGIYWVWTELLSC